MSESISKESISKDREKQILLAARNIFARFGFSKTTMEDISSEISMGKASLYYYFPTKESLFEAVISQERDEFLNEIECILAKHNTSAQKLKAYVEERIKFFKELMNLGMLSYHSFHEKKAVHQKLSDEFSSREIKVIEKIIQEGRSSGEFQTDINAKHMAVLFIHLLQGLRLRIIRNTSAGQMDNKEIAELHREMTLTTEIFIKAIVSKKEESSKVGR